MDLSIVIVNWNARDYLRKCLESIYGNSEALALEIFVVDNGSSDGSAEMLREKFPNVMLIENKGNPGFGAANNQALKVCASDLVLMLNPDTEVSAGALASMANFLRQNAKAGAVGAKLLNADKTIQLTCARNFPTILSEFFWLTTLVRRFPGNRIIGGYLMSYWDHNDKREVDCLSGACIMARLEVLRKLGYFDEDYFIYGEDVDLCYRIKKAGWQIWYLPEAEITHYGGGSSRGIAEAAAILDRIAIKTFFMKHRGILTAAGYRTMCLFTSLAMSAISGAILLFARERGKMKKVFLENLAVFEWSAGLRNK